MKFAVSVLIGLATTSLLGFAATHTYTPHNSFPIWSHYAPGETTLVPGKQQPFRPDEHPPVLRIREITQPLLQVFLPDGPRNGAAVLILPGGGFGKVVTNKEGSEAAQWLNKLGISAFVLSYRTSPPGHLRPWFRPLQDSQRAMRVIRSRAKEWSIDTNRIGLLGFSAGGQLAAIHLANTQPNAYDKSDNHDDASHRPNFALLIYPWNTLAPDTQTLRAECRLGPRTPPTFIVHTGDDQSTSLGSVALYVALKKQNIPAELHIYSRGGHGYGMRQVTGSMVDTWPDRATEWLHDQVKNSRP